jgi:hypothetical protein
LYRRRFEVVVVQQAVVDIVVTTFGTRRQLLFFRYRTCGAYDGQSGDDRDVR